jgi:hypothetical protein
MVLCFSLSGAQVKWRYAPLYEWNEDRVEKLEFDSVKKVWIDRSYYIDSWVYREPDKDKMRRMIEEMKRPQEIQSKKKYWLEFKKKPAARPEKVFTELNLLGAVLHKRRLVLLNPEANNNMIPGVKIHPHLGLLTVGTVAEQEGYEVVLWDELVQGHADLGQLVEPGDVVGLSIVITGAERSVDLARQAKILGAQCVIAGNDTAIFRCDQFLSLPGKPVDAVFTSNSTNSIRKFFREYDGSNLTQLRIPEFKTEPGGVQHSNQPAHMLVELRSRKQQKRAGQFGREDGFVVPNLELFPALYWKRVGNGYRKIYGHKHSNPATLKNASGLLAQGCTRTQGKSACKYCSIYGIGDIRVPSDKYLAGLLDAYNRFGITQFYNVTDSALEMAPLVDALERVGASFEGLTIYARAQGLATQPRLIERWQKLAGHLQLNVGLDSGNEAMLRAIDKSSARGLGSRLAENRQGLINLQSYSSAHLHGSKIIGGPGETRDSAEETLEFLHWAKNLLGDRLDVIESDLYWLNFGSRSAEVFTSYEYARREAALAGKTISREQWWQYFGRHRNDLVVSWDSQRAWYEFFTNISLEQAQEFNTQVSELMARHTGAISGRAFYPKAEDRGEAV